MSITVVTGPPCGGKTTHVTQHRGPDDLVVDLDSMAHALGYPERQIEWGSSHIAVAAARLARTQILRAVLAGQVRGHSWVIDTKPDRGLRAQYERAGARILTIDPGMAVCLERAAERDTSVIDGIRSWYGMATSRPPRSSALAVFR